MISGAEQMELNADLDIVSIFCQTTVKLMQRSFAE